MDEGHVYDKPLIFSVVVAIQIYKAFTISTAEVAKPFGKKQAEEPGFWDKLFKY